MSHVSRPLESTHRVRIAARLSWQPKSRLKAGLLGISLGAFGAHRFYLGYTKTASAQIAATLLTVGLAGLWGTLEGILILTGVFTKDALGRGMTQRGAIYRLSALGASLGLHLGAVFAMQFSAAYLLPPPSGMNSIELTATIESAAMSPEAEERKTAENPPIEIITATFPSTTPSPTLQDREDLAPSLAKSVALTRVEFPDPRLPEQRLEVRIEMAETAVSGRSPARTDLPDKPAVATSTQPDRRENRLERTELQVSARTDMTAATPSRARQASQEARGVQSDAPPERLAYSKPVYPPDLEARGITGLVKLRVRVGADGRVSQASVYQTSGYRAFDRSALDAIGSWRFQPARRAGIPVEMEILVPIRFVIESVN